MVLNYLVRQVLISSDCNLAKNSSKSFDGSFGCVSQCLNDLNSIGLCRCHQNNEIGKKFCFSVFLIDKRRVKLRKISRGWNAFQHDKFIPRKNQKSRIKLFLFNIKAKVPRRGGIFSKKGNGQKNLEAPI